MKLVKPIATFICLIFSIAFYAQEAPVEKNKKVEIFTPQERDNLQVWFHEKVKDMKLGMEVEEEYFSIVLYHIVKITRLDDKKTLTKEEIRDKAKTLLLKQNKEVKGILTEEQYAKHLSIFGDIIKSVHNRKTQQKDN
ncbi:hypothetical protein ACFSTE_08465 [Aquimarina hainanensis]|uniref:Uncharacterized protein n=1 Tax=Aquimarina hainanensis TaxID=1578017 RepID=A0ABW5N9J0_9FLAO|nr:hypothetical protein [Aquimarina sp. TRL1]QKX03972.1 hypothetical protein HN014_03315 [Aquimarina sp. TRL1]